MIGVFLPALRRVEQALADFAAGVRGPLARRRAGRRYSGAGQEVRNTQLASQRRDQTPSPCGRRHAAALSLPASFVLVRTWVRRYGDVIKAGGTELYHRVRVNSVQRTIEGAGSCLSVHSFSRLPRVAALPLVATRSANKHLAVQPSALVPQPSPAAALRRAPPLVRRATSPIASLTPAAADLTPLTADASARCPHTPSHPRTGTPVAGFLAFIQRPRRTPHVQ